MLQLIISLCWPLCVELFEAQWSEHDHRGILCEELLFRSYWRRQFCQKSSARLIGQLLLEASQCERWEILDTEFTLFPVLCWCHLQSFTMKFCSSSSLQSCTCSNTQVVAASVFVLTMYLRLQAECDSKKKKKRIFPLSIQQFLSSDFRVLVKLPIYFFSELDWNDQRFGHVIIHEQQSF